MKSYDDLARLAYDAYGEATGGKNFRGEPMPLFGMLPIGIQLAWYAACEAVEIAIREEECLP